MTTEQLGARHAEDQIAAHLQADLRTITNRDLVSINAVLTNRGPMELLAELPKIIAGPIVSAVLAKELMRRKAEGEL